MGRQGEPVQSLLVPEMMFSDLEQSSAVLKELRG